MREHLIRDWTKIEELKATYHDIFKSSVETIYRDLMVLRAGDAYDLRKSWTNIPEDLRVAICCMFISENVDSDYVFNEKITHIIHKRS